MRWMGHIVAGSRFNASVYIVSLPVAWRGHDVLNVGIFEKIRESAFFVRTIDGAQVVWRATVRHSVGFVMSVVSTASG